MLLNMEIFHDDTEYNATRIQMFQRVVDMFEHRSDLQRIVRLGLLEMNYTDGLDVASEDDYELGDWVHGPNNSRGYPRHSDRSSDRESSGNHTRSSTPGYQFPLRYYSAAGDLPSEPFGKVQPKDSNTERRARLLQEEKKSKGKAEKKRLKKQKQKARKQKEKLEKEKHNPVKDEEEKTHDETEESEAVGSSPVKNDSNSSAKELASAKDTDSDSSEDESSDEDSDSKNDSEELDMTSTFVSKAALIARRKLEQKPKPEKKEKPKIPVNKEPKNVPDEANEDPAFENKHAAVPSSRTLEDNVKISTDLANIGNKFASAGDFNTAVKYFTDAIKYNPTEYKLFGNRSFCFEKMQEYMKALTDAELSLGMCPGWVKGLFRKGRALAGLKRYEEAAKAFREVLKLDSSCAEAAQELMRVQITQLMEYGFTRQQSSNALIIHGTVQKALEVLSKLNQQPEAIKNGIPQLPQVANVSGVSPVLSASTNPAAPQSHDATKAVLKSKPLGPVQNMPNGKSQPKPIPNQAMKTTSEASRTQRELFPIWVGNLVYPVTETIITNLFNKVGVVCSVKVLTARRCAFVNYTKQEDCDEAIRHFHGFELNGMKIAVRYPDRIPHGMGFSKSALRADDLQDENVGHNNYGDGRSPVGSGRPVRPYRQVPNHGGNHKE